jgi:Penicillin binding protein transpeptidase domain/NTF2-like N-terminal transpeptidase domain/Penicillin-binding Protein dimerisation domain
VGGFRSRPPLLRVIAAAVAVAFGAAGFAGGLFSPPSAEPTVQAFLLDWQQHSYAAAAALTDGRQPAVTAALRNAYRGLDAAAYYLSMGRITQHGSAAVASFSASVDLGQDGAPWNYHGHFTLHDTSSGWKIAWNPSLINPGLRWGLRLAMVSTTPRRKPLLDSASRPLQTPSTAFVAGVRPGRLARPAVTARALGRVTGIDADELLGWILAAPRGSFSELVVFKPHQYSHLAHRLAKVPGLIIHRERLRLFSSIAPAVVGAVGTEASAALRDQGIAYRPGATVGLSGLQQAYQHDLAGTPTTEVVTETMTGSKIAVLKRWRGQDPQAVRTTINAQVQTAAMNAVASAQGSAAVVAVQASTGRILGVASRTAPHVPPVSPLGGKYPPGGAFTIVSTGALLASGMGVDKPVRCTRVNDVGGRIFRNVPPEPNLGAEPTFATDFAHSCMTAFSGLSERLTGHDLSTAAQGFGLGATWHLPLRSFSGSVAASGGFAQIAADTIGQGSIRVSPLAMALVAGEVRTGEWHAPSLVSAPGKTQPSRHAPLHPATLSTLRSLMRSAVRTGAAKEANLRGVPVFGQVGTVATGAGKHRRWASWFVGYRGDVAFAVLEITHAPGPSAVQIGTSFLGFLAP